MPFSIELFFDTKSDMAIRKLAGFLEKGKVPTIFSTLGATPHVTLAVFDQYDPGRLHWVLKKSAGSFPSFPLRLSSLGSFPGKEGVLFLAPVVTSQLLEIQAGLHRALSKVIQGSWPHYWPSQWVPHCTLAIRLSSRKLMRAFELLRKKDFRLTGLYNHLALVETHPVHIKPIRLVYSVPLKGKKRRGENV